MCIDLFELVWKINGVTYTKSVTVIASRKVNLRTEGQDWKLNVLLALYHIILFELCAFDHNK